MLKINNLPDEVTNYNYSKIVREAIVSPDEVYVRPKSILRFGGGDILTEGNLSMIQGQAKSRKTFFISLLIREVLSQGHWVAMFDTEQFKHHSLLFNKRVAAMTDRHSNFKMYNLRKYTKEVRFELMSDYIQEHKPPLFVLDNVRDVIKDYNSIEQADKVATTLAQLSELTGTHILVTLHENKNDGNARGHLGAELTQKAETVMNVATEDEITRVTGKFTRNKPFDDITFGLEDLDMGGYQIAIPKLLGGLSLPSTNVGVFI